MRQRSQPAIHVSSLQRGQLADAAFGQDVHRVVQQVVQAYAGRLGLGLVVPEHDRDVDAARAQQVQRLGRVRVDEAHLERGVPPREPLEGSGDERADGRGEAGQAYPAGRQPDVPRQLGVRRVDPADDLGGAVREQPTGLGQPDAAADPLEQLGAGLGLEPGEVVADGGLGVVQLLGGLGDRAEPAHGLQDPETSNVQHLSMLSMVSLVGGARLVEEGSLAPVSRPGECQDSFFVAQKISAISSILASSWSATSASRLPFAPEAPASLVASLTSWCSCGYFSKCGGLK